MGLAGSAVAESAVVTVRQGLTWSPSPSTSVRFGIGNVWQDAKGAVLASVHVMPVKSTIGWEALQDVHAGDTVPTADGVFRVLSVTPPEQSASSAPGSPDHGAVSFSASPEGQRFTPDSVFLVAGGSVTFGDKDPLRQMTLQVESWLPDAQVSVRWLPSYLVGGDATPAEVHHATVRAGATVQIGSHTLSIASVTPPADAHPGWIMLRLP